ncbi:hypothetical protein QQ020_31295 [Fulvivirgaceae bacterium BMA12]|uniref:Uncharacterized protein n=1 Tax=Agaribacillus aureus TaxID=3051825 RepID=A0ABT8LFN0_9BACT|nr:hypothetical protein [Fulvivirgaceae bacterium BMA12]
MKRLISTSAVLAIAISISAFINIDPTKEPIQLTFVDHLKAGLIEQDVYVEKTPGSGKVFRVLPEEREKYLNAPVYTTSKSHHHDPFDKQKCGPYNKGVALGMTLGEWLSASGTATYECEAGWGTLKASFENLAPNTTYTMWHFFMPAPPTVPFMGTLDIPMGDRDGKHSVFTTDAKGRASMDIKFEHCLQLSNSQLASGIAIAMHSDGKTYGPDPGPFGSVTHVQLFAMLPHVNDHIAGR